MAVIIPKLHEFDGKIGINGIITYVLFSALLVELIVYPLSDLFAVILCSTPLYNFLTI